jgi:hypothetical protein
MFIDWPNLRGRYAAITCMSIKLDFYNLNIERDDKIHRYNESQLKPLLDCSETC